jgi:hypothetical protein
MHAGISSRYVYDPAIPPQPLIVEKQRSRQDISVDDIIDNILQPRADTNCMISNILYACY